VIGRLRGGLAFNIERNKGEEEERRGK